MTKSSNIIIDRSEDGQISTMEKELAALADMDAEVAVLTGVTEGARRAVFTDTEERAATLAQAAGVKMEGKLAEAQQFQKNTLVGLKTVVRGIERRCADLQIRLQTDQDYQGLGEKFFGLLGFIGWQSAKERADNLRQLRVDSLDYQSAVDMVMSYGTAVIARLKNVEQIYTTDCLAYERHIDQRAKKLANARATLEQVQQDRAELESEVQKRQNLLNDGLLEASERGQTEQALYKQEAELRKLVKREAELLERVTNTQSALPELRKNLKASQETETFIRGIRRSLFEHLDNWSEVMRRAGSAVRVQAYLDVYQDVLPAVAKTAEVALENNLRTNLAAAEIFERHAGKLAISKQKSEELAEILFQSNQTLAEVLGNLSKRVENAPEEATPLSDVADLTDDL